MSASCLTWLSSLCILIQFNQLADCYPNPDLSNLHYFDESFDLIQEESRLQPTAIAPPPAEFVIREKIPFASLFDEESQTEPSFLRPVAIKKQTIIQVEPLKKSVSHKISSVVPDKHRELTTTRLPPPPPSAVTRTHPQPRRDEDSTQAYGVLENAALSLQDDDQLAIHNVSSNCSTIDATHTDLPEKPILKPHELEEGVIAEAKLDAVASTENQQVFSSRETNAVTVNPELLDEFGQGSEVQPVVQEPVNFTVAKEHCNETASLPGDVSNVTTTSTEAATASQAESSNVAEETTAPSSSEASTPTDATLLESTDVAPPSADQVQASSSHATSSEKSALPAPSSTQPILHVEEIAVAPSVSAPAASLETASSSPASPSASEEAALLPKLPIQKDSPRPSDELETAEQTAVVETTAPSVGNSSIILLEEAGADNANGASEETGSYEDGQVVVAVPTSEAPKGEKHWAEYVKALMPNRRLDAEAFTLLTAKIWSILD